MIWHVMLPVHVLRHQGDVFILSVGVSEKGLGHFYALNKGEGVTNQTWLRNLAKEVSKQVGRAAPRGRKESQPKDSGSGLGL